MYINHVKEHLSFWFNYFLDSRAEIHQFFAFGFLENLRNQKVILKLTDLYQGDQKYSSIEVIGLKQ